MSAEPVTFEMDSNLVSKLDQAVASEHSSRAAVMERALERYFASEGDELDLIRAGIEDADAGRVTDLQDSLADLDSWN